MVDRSALFRTKTVAFKHITDIVDDPKNLHKIADRFDGTNLPDALNPLARM